MKEYIEREAACAEIKRFAGYIDNDMILRLQIAVQKLPAADVVEVVQCLECKYHNKPRLGFCEIHLVRTNGNDFCSYGERKGGDD